MAIDLRRIKAVSAALKGIRERVDYEPDVEIWSTAPFNNAIRLLEGALPVSTAHLNLEAKEMAGRDLFVHLDAAIAFLDIYDDGDVEAAEDEDEPEDDDDDVYGDDDDDPEEVDLDEMAEEEADDTASDDKPSQSGGWGTILGFPRRK